MAEGEGNKPAICWLERQERQSHRVPEPDTEPAPFVQPYRPAQPPPGGPDLPPAARQPGLSSYTAAGHTSLNSRLSHFSYLSNQTRPPVGHHNPSYGGTSVGPHGAAMAAGLQQQSYGGALPGTNMPSIGGSAQGSALPPPLMSAHYSSAQQTQHGPYTPHPSPHLTPQATLATSEANMLPFATLNPGQLAHLLDQTSQQLVSTQAQLTQLQQVQNILLSHVTASVRTTASSDVIAAAAVAAAAGGGGAAARAGSVGGASELGGGGGGYCGSGSIARLPTGGTASGLVRLATGGGVSVQGQASRPASGLIPTVAPLGVPSAAAAAAAAAQAPTPSSPGSFASANSNLSRVPSRTAEAPPPGLAAAAAAAGAAPPRVELPAAAAASSGGSPPPAVAPSPGALGRLRPLPPPPAMAHHTSGAHALRSSLESVPSGIELPSMALSPGADGTAAAAPAAAAAAVAAAAVAAAAASGGSSGATTGPGPARILGKPPTPPRHPVPAAPGVDPARQASAGLPAKAAGAADGGTSGGGAAAPGADVSPSKVPAPTATTAAGAPPAAAAATGAPPAAAAAATGAAAPAPAAATLATSGGSGASSVAAPPAAAVLPLQPPAPSAAAAAAAAATAAAAAAAAAAGGLSPAASAPQSSWGAAEAAALGGLVSSTGGGGGGGGDSAVSTTNLTGLLSMPHGQTPPLPPPPPPGPLPVPPPLGPAPPSGEMVRLPLTEAALSAFAAASAAPAAAAAASLPPPAGVLVDAGGAVQPADAPASHASSGAVQHWLPSFAGGHTDGQAVAAAAAAAGPTVAAPSLPPLPEFSIPLSAMPTAATGFTYDQSLMAALAAAAGTLPSGGGTAAAAAAAAADTSHHHGGYPLIQHPPILPDAAAAASASAAAAPVMSPAAAAAARRGSRVDPDDDDDGADGSHGGGEGGRGPSRNGSANGQPNKEPTDLDEQLGNNRRDLLVFPEEEEDAEEDEETASTRRRWWRRPRVVSFLGSAFVGLVLLFVGLILDVNGFGGVNLEQEVYRWLYFISGIVAIYWIVFGITYWVFHLLEWIFFRENLTYLEVVQQHTTTFVTMLISLIWFQATFRWLWCDKPPGRCDVPSYVDAVSNTWNAILCIMIFTLANLLKTVIAKVSSMHFYRTAHYKKLKASLEKEYYMQLLSVPRSRLVIQMELEESLRATSAPACGFAPGPESGTGPGSDSGPGLGAAAVTSKSPHADGHPSAGARADLRADLARRSMAPAEARLLLLTDPADRVKGVFEYGFEKVRYGVAGIFRRGGGGGPAAAVLPVGGSMTHPSHPFAKSGQERQMAAAAAAAARSGGGQRSNANGGAGMCAGDVALVIAGNSTPAPPPRPPGVPMPPPPAPPPPGPHTNPDPTSPGAAAAGAAPAAAYSGSSVDLSVPVTNTASDNPRSAPYCTSGRGAAGMVTAAPFLVTQGSSGLIPGLQGGGARHLLGLPLPPLPLLRPTCIQPTSASDGGDAGGGGPAAAVAACLRTAPDPISVSAPGAAPPPPPPPQQQPPAAVDVASSNAVLSGNMRHLLAGAFAEHSYPFGKNLHQPSTTTVASPTGGGAAAGTSAVAAAAAVLSGSHAARGGSRPASRLGLASAAGGPSVASAAPTTTTARARGGPRMDRRPSHKVAPMRLSNIVDEDAKPDAQQRKLEAIGVQVLGAAPHALKKRKDMVDMTEDELEKMRTAIVIKTYTALIRKHNAMSEADQRRELRTVKRFARALFFNIRGPDPARTTIREEDFRPFFANDTAMARKAFETFDPDNKGELTRADVRARVISIYAERANMARSLRDTDSIVQSLEFSVGAVIHFLFCAIYLSIWGVPLLEGFSAFSTTVLALTFIFGNAAKNAFESVLFLFFEHPYDVGDMVFFNNDSMRVKRISLLYTDFVKWTDEEIYIPNTKMMQHDITNWTRTRTKFELHKFLVDVGVPWEVKQDINNALVAHAAANPNDFTGTPRVTFRELVDPLKIYLGVGFTYNFPPDDLLRLVLVRDKLMYVLQCKLAEHGLRYSRHEINSINAPEAIRITAQMRRLQELDATGGGAGGSGGWYDDPMGGVSGGGMDPTLGVPAGAVGTGFPVPAVAPPPPPPVDPPPPVPSVGPDVEAWAAAQMGAPPPPPPPLTLPPTTTMEVLLGGGGGSGSMMSAGGGGGVAAATTSSQPALTAAGLQQRHPAAAAAGSAAASIAGSAAASAAALPPPPPVSAAAVAAEAAGEEAADKRKRE
ncbi:hypothetical protein HYH03_010684 [Edaphochlamys debaryana]|uniref:EF-hand domain-containing protein n=1 Tax=Edaphochlamys debaryana TaxID=47281 RepID=A0A835XTP9_9CHLO|nr:hypothetical protein HYH03_010684 [Edaphochlamys debaryana]|eukprot:KAG2491012.1 hypothetical protein HYH03_010684 [Edaphochlamys debaryana]